MEIDEIQPEIAELKVEKDPENFMLTSNFKTEVTTFRIIIELAGKLIFFFILENRQCRHHTKIKCTINVGKL